MMAIENTVSVRMACMVTAKGTACVETALCALHDTPENRERVMQQGRELGLNDAVEWIDDGRPELLTCMICGMRSDGTSENDDAGEE